MTHQSDSRSFELFYRAGWAYLVVHPPSTGGGAVYVDDVRNRMRILGIPPVSAQEIRRVVEEASGTPRRLVAWPAGERLASTITIIPADDRMSATAEIGPPKKGGAPPTREEIVRALTEAGVVAGVDGEAIDHLVGKPVYDEPVVVARGREPRHARGREVRYHFSTTRGKPYLEMDFGRINLKELHFIENKKKGELLAELLSPVPAVDGVTVFGTAIPANTESEPAELRGGKNVRVAADAVYAEADGNVRLEKGAIIVEPVVSVKNVGYETGNIHLDGSLVVAEEIADGFEIEVTGDVQVGKGVGKASIKAGGNVLLKTGMNGGGNGRIDCGGNLLAKYIESSTVTTRGNLIVEEAIMHSTASVWKHCVLNGRRSEIIASAVTAGGSIWCKKLGSIYEAPTHVAVGVHPEVLGEYNRARETVDARQARFEIVEEQLEQLERAVRAGKRDERVMAAVEQLQNEKATLAAELGPLRHRQHELREELTASRKSFLVAEDTMFKGASVAFGTAEFHPPEKGTRKTVLRAGEDGVIESGFNPYEPPHLVFDEDEATDQQSSG